jgi:hypothetical protein
MSWSWKDLSKYLLLWAGPIGVASFVTTQTETGADIAALIYSVFAMFMRYVADPERLAEFGRATMHALEVVCHTVLPPAWSSSVDGALTVLTSPASKAGFGVAWYFVGHFVDQSVLSGGITAMLTLLPVVFILHWAIWGFGKIRGAGN